tara:strand:- start:466 stop:1455 length:990 start_codon:yes stop_codon:yes gene_type:complete
MATLNDLARQVKRKMGLSQGSHSLTFTTNTVDGDTITINGIKLTLRATPAVAEFNVSRASTAANAMATAFKASIDGGFGEAQGITAGTPSGATVVLTGARTVESSNSSGCSVTISDTEMEPPTFSDILEWIKEGQLDVTNKANDQSLMAEATSMIEEATIETSSASNELTPPSDFLRPIVLRYVTRVAGDKLTRAEKIPFDLLIDIRDDKHPFYVKSKNPEEGNKWYSIFNGKIQTAGLVSQAIDAEIMYIKKPQTTAATECDLPESLEKLVVDYACYKSLISIGKEEESQLYLQQYLLDIQALNAKYGFEDKNTHETKPNDARLQGGV